jgi:hypothetical protein
MTTITIIEILSDFLNTEIGIEIHEVHPEIQQKYIKNYLVSEEEKDEKTILKFIDIKNNGNKSILVGCLDENKDIIFVENKDVLRQLAELSQQLLLDIINN